MKLIKPLTLALVAGLLAINSLAAPLEIHGVKLDDSATVSTVKLQLNGAGTRYKAIFKVYVAGLYLGKKASTLADVINQPGPKRLSVTMLRDVDAEEMAASLTHGLEDNTAKSELPKLAANLQRMNRLFAEQKKLLSGDNFMIEWLPGVGTVITAKGKALGEPFKEPEFFNALMSIWLGTAPADSGLKDALLGLK